MKLFLNSFFLIAFFICSPALGDIFLKKYIIYTSGIKIGELDWEIKVNDKNYSNNIVLKSSGILSSLYNFEGNYYSSGNIYNQILAPQNYKHSWKTNKANKKMLLFFNNNKLESLNQKPVEKNKLRLNIFKIKQVKDPLTSFLQILFGAEKSLVVDGRRFYTMNALYNKSTQQIVVNLTNYSNLWADHKRNKFEKITFKKNNNNFLPYEMFIYFDGRVFKLKEN